jgi:hypothetical protein
MRTRFTFWFWSLASGVACALALLPGCNSSSSSSAVTPAGLWSCFDTGSGVSCLRQSALATGDVDVNGDGVPDHFLCADDDDDNHDRGRDQDLSGHAVSGNDGDHDGVDDTLDCDARAACRDLSDDDNADRHEAAEDEADGGHRSGDSQGGNAGNGGKGGNGGNGGLAHDADGDDHGNEMHPAGACAPPAT